MKLILAVVIFFLGKFVYQIVSNTDWKDPMLLEEAKEITLRSSVEGVSFDIPLLYKHHLYEKNFNKWPRHKDYERHELDGVKVIALLPNMEPYTEQNADEFNISVHGNKLHILMTPIRVNWPYYFDNAFKRLIHLPESPIVPGMFHYRDPMGDNQDIYMSDNQPVRELIEITCENPELDPHPSVSPDCRVIALYRNQFQLNYYYSLKHMGQWREIDKNVRLLLDSFIESAIKNP